MWELTLRKYITHINITSNSFHDEVISTLHITIKEFSVQVYISLQEKF